MITYNHKLYTDETVEKKLKKYKKRIEKKKLLSSYYIISLPFNSDNCLDIYSGMERWLSEYKKDTDIEVVGIAANKKSMFEVLENITKDVVEKYDTFDKESVKKFFEEM
ncbi:MAG: hypothetical protein K6D02_07240 [Lachnospiraceae bacterium]|nr:hypothetical protein [Lachnospiraceae bacterium]